MILNFNGKIIQVELEKNNNDFTITAENQKKNISISQFSENCVLIKNGSQIKKFYFAKGDRTIYVNSDGYTSKFEILDIEESSQFDFDKNSTNKDIIKPPMPGSIVKILVELGQKVSEGQPLIVVEAMKMETSLYSSIDGTVTELNVKAGEQVDSDKVLLIVEKQ